MLIRVQQQSLPFFEALASDVRIRALELLAERDMNIKELAQAVGISSPMMLKHVRKLEDAGLIVARMVNRNGSVQKLCTLLGTEYRVEMPKRHPKLRDCHEVQIPVGHYTGIDCNPTCGLATESEIIGQLDDPRYFLEPARMNAQIIWFGSGFVEYCIPNHLAQRQRIEEIEVSFEIASEAPGYNDDWPSDITFSLNGVRLCEWTSPGDFGDKRGILTPAWWSSNQYGLMKVLRITDEGTFLDGERASDVALGDVLTGGERKWVLRFAVEAGARHVGGMTLFGSKFGNYSQDILVRTFYKRPD